MLGYSLDKEIKRFVEGFDPTNIIHLATSRFLICDGEECFADYKE
jgi:hypothetical protein